jgi:hypothetical protein
VVDRVSVPLHNAQFALEVESVMSEWVAASCCTKVKLLEGQCELIAQWTLVLHQIGEGGQCQGSFKLGPSVEGTGVLKGPIWPEAGLSNIGPLI